MKPAIALVLAVAVGALAGYWFGLRHTEHAPAPVDLPPCIRQRLFFIAADRHRLSVR